MKIFLALKSNNISSIFPMNSFELLHNYLKMSSDKFPVSEKIAKYTISIPIYPSLNINDIIKISQIIKNV